MEQLSRSEEQVMTALWAAGPAPATQGNKNLYTPLVRRATYCGAVSAAHLQTLYDGDLRGLTEALAATGRLDRTQVNRLLRWLDTWLAENEEYDYE